ncbi:MAG: glycosyltransferase family 2 protein, partial [Bacteroidota bacterium]
CLNSVKAVADEIIVVDSYSTDKTREIVESFPAKFILNKFEGHIQQKNFAMRSAQHDIVLSLDADEELSDTLKASIAHAKQHWTGDGYSFNRLNSYCGKFIHHGGWYPDRKIRLWNRNKGSWGGENPHDLVIMDNSTTVSHLKGDLLHYTYRTQTEHLTQMNKFSDIAARELFKRDKKTSVILHLLLNPFFTFIKTYFFRLGFLDGYAGFQVAMHGAYYRFLKYSKLKFLHDNKSAD